VFGGAQRGRAAVAATAAAALSLIVILLSGGPGVGAEARRGGLHLRQMATFDQPVYIENAPGFRKLLFVVEKKGRVQVLRDEDTRIGHPFLNITGRVLAGAFDEQGLLGIAFDPDYKNNRRFYVYYTNNGGTNQVDLFKRKRGSSTRAVEKSRRKIIELGPVEGTNHNGGTIQFGPDGRLWLAPGEGGDHSNAQDKGNLLGKLLRITPKAGGGHREPDSNPFVGEAGRDEIWARGLRNPFRFSFDSETGDLALADVGGGSFEEVNIRSRGSAKGGNFGWPICEGPDCSPGGPPNKYLPPIFEYPHNGHCGASCAITGGVVVRNPDLPAINGRYLYADHYDGIIRHINPNTGGNDTSTALDAGAPTSFVEGRNGRVYVTSINGPVFRIVQN
jgi:glucose/arabinose dehydrogenase